MSSTGNPYADTSEMHTAHTTFRREFALLPGLVRSVSTQDPQHAQAVIEHTRLLCALLHHHHSAEDRVLWPLLLARAPKEIDPVVHLVEGHHRDIEDLLLEVEQRLNAGRDGVTGVDGAAFARLLQRLAVALHQHMDLEEQVVLPVVARHVFASEWDQMAEGMEQVLTPNLAPVMFGMAMYEAGWDSMSERVPSVMADLAPKAYAAYAERLHGTATPPRSTELIIGTPDIGIAGQETRREF